MTRGAVAVSESDVAASMCRESFAFFVKEFWSQVSQEKLRWNWHMQYLCELFQQDAERVFLGLPRLHDEIINVPPGTSKSTIFSIMGPAWVWTRMPHAKFICGSYTDALALDLANKSRMVINSDLYGAYFPEIQLRDDQNTKHYFANTRGGMRYSIGTDGSVIGMHAHFIIVDDPLDPRSAVSDGKIKSSNSWITETLPSRKVDKRVTVTMLIMQRLHQNDPSGHILDSGKTKVRHTCFPAEFEEENVKPLNRVKKYYDENGGLLDPVRLSREVLTDAETELGEYAYACQFCQHPIPKGGGMFKVDKFINGMEKSAKRPLPTRFVRIVRYWDKAATPKAGAFTVGVKMALDHEGYYWILDVVRGQWDSHSREMRIKATAIMDGKEVRIVIEQEPGSGGLESVEATIRRLAGYSVKKDPVKGDKELRADPYSDQVNGGNVGLAPRVHWSKEFLTEHRFFPYSRYKDQVDAAAGAFAWLSKPKTKVGAF